MDYPNKKDISFIDIYDDEVATYPRAVTYTGTVSTDSQDSKVLIADSDGDGFTTNFVEFGNNIAGFEEIRKGYYLFDGTEIRKVVGVTPSAQAITLDSPFTTSCEGLPLKVIKPILLPRVTFQNTGAVDGSIYTKTSPTDQTQYGSITLKAGDGYTFDSSTLSAFVIDSTNTTVKLSNAFFFEVGASGGGGGGGGSATLFPNGYNFIDTDYVLQASDEGKLIIALGENPIHITVPTGSDVFTNKVIGISMVSQGDFEIESGVAVTPLHQTNDGLGIGDLKCETVICQTFTGDGMNALSVLSTSVINDNGSYKTMLRYLYDKSQDAIPLSGTEVGKPVIGSIKTYSNIEFYSDDDIKVVDISNEDGTSGLISIGNNSNNDKMYFSPTSIAFSNDNGTSSYIYYDGTDLIIGVYDGIHLQKVLFGQSGIFVLNNGSGTQKGIAGEIDFSNNIDDLDYTQKKYVGYRGTATLSSGTVTISTDKIRTGYKIYVSVNTPSGTQGFLSAPSASIVDSTSFVINSTSAGDNSTVNWWIAP